jgi:hypothetical protein
VVPPGGCGVVADEAGYAGPRAGVGRAHASARAGELIDAAHPWRAISVAANGRPTCKENRFAGLPQPDRRPAMLRQRQAHHTTNPRPATTRSSPPTPTTALPRRRSRCARTSAAAGARGLSWPPDRRRLGAVALNVDRQPQRMASIGALHRTRKVLLTRQGAHPPAAQAIASRDLRTVKQAAGRGQDAPRRVRDLLLIITGRHEHAVRADSPQPSVRDRGAHRDRRPAT